MYMCTYIHICMAECLYSNCGHNSTKCDKVTDYSLNKRKYWNYIGDSVVFNYILRIRR